ncbi:MAG: glycosyltransferase family 4 protein, partial [Planctomycetota bacterium]
MPASSAPTILVISQVYVPDPASVGQHMHDAAADLAARGYRVVVYASANGYDDPSRKYPRRETLDGVDIRRLPFSSLGKKSIAARLAGGGVFLLQAFLHALFTARLAGILVSTSPPHAPLAAIALSRLRRAPLTFWAMDINPDQMIAMGKTAATSMPARLFDWMYRMTLRRAAAVVALDRFMAERLERKVGADALADKMHILPPWSHDDHLEPVPHDDNPFRHEHGLDGKLVVMYSGNISPAHPLDTVLEAAERLRDEDGLVFLFIGGGLQKEKIEAWAKEKDLANVRTLPYQPLDRIKYSLSAADVHLVSMGEAMVGIV